MLDVVLLSLTEGGAADACCSGGGCGSAEQAQPDSAAAGGRGEHGGCGERGEHGVHGGCGERCEHGGCGERGRCAPRVPVLECAAALTAAGARVRTVTASSDEEIDEALVAFDDPARPDGLTWPAANPNTRFVVATAVDGQLRAVLRRLVRRYAPPPSRRPADLASDRTVPDLPPMGLLPLDASADTDLAAQLGLPRSPAAVAAAVLAGRVRRLDLLRNDGGSVTVDGALLGGADDDGRAVPWRGRIEVDDTVLSDGDDPILACAIGNGAGYAEFDGLRLLSTGDPTDGRVEVAVAVPSLVKQRFRGTKVRVEVRRARGRAVSVLPRDGVVQFLDDGVGGSTSRKRSWWTEPGAWAVYAD